MPLQPTTPERPARPARPHPTNSGPELSSSTLSAAPSAPSPPSPPSPLTSTRSIFRLSAPGCATSPGPVPPTAPAPPVEPSPTHPPHRRVARNCPVCRGARKLARHLARRPVPAVPTEGMANTDVPKVPSPQSARVLPWFAREKAPSPLPSRVPLATTPPQLRAPRAPLVPLSPTATCSMATCSTATCSTATCSTSTCSSTTTDCSAPSCLVHEWSLRTSSGPVAPPACVAPHLDDLDDDEWERVSDELPIPLEAASAAAAAAAAAHTNSPAVSGPPSVASTLSVPSAPVVSSTPSMSSKPSVSSTPSSIPSSASSTSSKSSTPPTPSMPSGPFAPSVPSAPDVPSAASVPSTHSNIEICGMGTSWHRGDYSLLPHAAAHRLPSLPTAVSCGRSEESSIPTLSWAAFSAVPILYGVGSTPPWSEAGDDGGECECDAPIVVGEGLLLDYDAIVEVL